MIVPLQPTNYYFNNALLALTDATPVVSLLTVPTLMLGTASITPNLGTLVADLVEATFVGYTRSAVIVWDLPINDVDTTPTAQAPRNCSAVLPIRPRTRYSIWL